MELNISKLVRDIDQTETALWELRELRSRRAKYQNQAVEQEVGRLEGLPAGLRSWLWR